MPFCWLNEHRVALPAAPDTRLLDFLRASAGLTAAKPACGTGDCGACLVLLGECAPGATQPQYRAVNSCLLLTGQLAGRHVITAEGLAGETPDAAPGPVQQALLAAGAVQCGYCTPGLVVALTAALLAGQPLLAGVAGNLCRCTGYAGIRRACAVLQASQPERPIALAEAVALGLLPSAVAAVAELLKPPPGLSLPLPAGAHAVAGASDWSVQTRHAPLGQPVFSLRDVAELRGIAAEVRAWRIGAAVTIAELQQDAALAGEWPELGEALQRFASPGVRNLASIGGNLVNASPIADLAVLLLALDADLEINDRGQALRLPLACFYTGYKQTRLPPGGVLVAIRLPRNPGRAWRLHFEKLARRQDDDIATVNSAFCWLSGADGAIAEARLSAGGVAPCALRLDGVAAALCAVPLTPATLQAALVPLGAAIAPIDDLRGSAAYKRRLLGHLIIAHAQAAQPGFAAAACLS